MARISVFILITLLLLPSFAFGYKIDSVGAVLTAGDDERPLMSAPFHKGVTDGNGYLWIFQLEGAQNTWAWTDDDGITWSGVNNNMDGDYHTNVWYAQGIHYTDPYKNTVPVGGTEYTFIRYPGRSTADAEIVWKCGTQSGDLRGLLQELLFIIQQIDLLQIRIVGTFGIMQLTKAINVVVL